MGINMRTNLIKRAIDEAEVFRGQWTGHPEAAEILNEFDRFIAGARNQLAKLKTERKTLRTENDELRAELEKLKVDVNVHPDHRINDFY